LLVQNTILGIETSCDETAAAVVADGRLILSNVISSQIETHTRYGGVVPELASREHLRAIVPVVTQALAKANRSLAEPNAIAVTQGPGLVGSLLVGITYAKALSFARSLPLIGVNHVEAHIHSVLMQNDVEFPVVALVVSGGHTHLYAVQNTGSYRLLGRTRDDAAGEAFDKVAKLLGFPYPGGPVIDALARHGNERAVRFTPPKIKGSTLDFSFSGMKTAVLHWTEQHDVKEEIAKRRGLSHPSVEDLLALTPKPTLDLLASFQYAVVEELLRRSASAAEEIGADTVVVAGGVSCNTGLRLAAKERAGLRYLFPPPFLSTDNAAMIAAAAYPKFRAGQFAGMDLKAQAGLVLG
jgi:N6-L-threonylcarbamoyladenine synthase